MTKKNNPYLGDLGKYMPINAGAGKTASGVGLEASIAQQSFKNNADTRNEHDDDADLFASLGAAAGPNPRGGAALFSGFAKGLEYGSKRKSTDKKQESLDKYNRGIDYLQNQLTELNKRNEWYEKRAFAKQKYLPQMLTYAQSVNTLDPQSRKMMLDDIMSGYNQSIGEDNKIVSIDGSNPFLVTIKNGEGELTVLDTRNLFDGDPNAQAILSPLYPQFLAKQEEARNQMKLENDRKADKFELEKYKAGVESKFGNKGEGENPYGSVLSKSLPKGSGSVMSTLNADIKIAQEIPVIMKQMDEAEEIIRLNPAIGRGWANFLSKGFPAGMPDKLRVAYEKLNKISSRVAEAFIRSKGGAISDSERETIKKGLFDATLLPQSNEFNINSVREELVRAKEYGHFAAEELAKGYVATPASFEKYLKKKIDGATGVGMDGADTQNQQGGPFASRWRKVQ